MLSAEADTPPFTLSAYASSNKPFITHRYRAGQEDDPLLDSKSPRTPLLSTRDQPTGPVQCCNSPNVVFIPGQSLRTGSINNEFKRQRSLSHIHRGYGSQHSREDDEGGN